MPLRLLPLILLLAPSLPAQDIAAQADRFVQSFVDQKLFQGSVLLAREGRPVFRKSYGLANAEWNIANTPDTRYRMASLTKQFTSALIMQLVEQGKIRLDDPISKYYTEAPASWQAITIHHLLCAESGIPDYLSNLTLPGGFRKIARTAVTPTEIIGIIRDQPLEFEPGSKNKYVNTGYALLGYTIEKVTGRTFEEQLREAILKPLGMTDTGYDTNSLVLPRRAEGYRYVGDGLERAPFSDMSLMYSAAGVYSTVDDLLKWDQALYGTRVLKEVSKQRTWSPNLGDYGYGWAISRRFGMTAVEHPGAISGFRTVIIRIPEKSLLAVVLANMETLAFGHIASGLLGIALGETVAGYGENASIKLPAERLKLFEGTYVLNPGFSVAVRPQGGDHLSTEGQGSIGWLVGWLLGPVPMNPVSATRFSNDVVGAQIEFEPDGTANTGR